MVWFVLALELACGSHIEPRLPEEMRTQPKPERVEPSSRERAELLDICRQMLPVVLPEQSQLMFGRDGFMEPGQVLFQVQEKEQWRLYTPFVWEDCLPDRTVLSRPDNLYGFWCASQENREWLVVESASVSVSGETASVKIIYSREARPEDEVLTKVTEQIEWIFVLDSGAWKLAHRKKDFVSQGVQDCANWTD